MKKQEIEKLVSELRVLAEAKRSACTLAKTPARVLVNRLDAGRFDEAADALERILKEGSE